MKTTYRISTLTLATSLTACTDGIIGEWDGIKISSIEDSSSSYALPFEYCQSYNGEETCNTIDFSLSVQEDLTGSMEISIYSLLLEPSVVVEKQDGGNYKITASIASEESTLNLDCTLTDAENLQCTESQDLEAIIDFKKE